MKPQPPEVSTQEALAGVVERVTYHNAETGFAAATRRVVIAIVVTVVGRAAAMRPASGSRHRVNGQRSHSRPAVQGAVLAHLAPDVS